MNDVSPLEAQAFNYLSFGFLTLLNNFWTWLALPFWRIRTPKSELLPPPDESEPVAVSEPAPPRLPTALGNGAVDVDGARKGKFTLYYEGDETECESDETVTEERDGKLEWWESWERLLRMRRGENENGWYTCQDLTAFNGSVVRLWDGGFTRESRDSSSCVLVC
ncbi:hypothetical protein E2542_SST18793 [Spatholobus suberectus]|nr:hypothetical protein E2542_SST18793 [Spatholobus suberectus]